MGLLSYDYADMILIDASAEESESSTETSLDEDIKRLEDSSMVMGLDNAEGRTAFNFYLTTTSFDTSVILLQPPRF